MVDDKYRTWCEELVPALEKNNIFFLRYDELRVQKSNITRSTLKNRFTPFSRRWRWIRSIPSHNS